MNQMDKDKDHLVFGKERNVEIEEQGDLEGMWG